MSQTEFDVGQVGFDDINLLDSKPFADGVPHHWFAFLRENAPVWWQDEEDGPGFWRRGTSTPPSMPVSLLLTPRRHPRSPAFARMRARNTSTS